MKKKKQIILEMFDNQRVFTIKKFKNGEGYPYGMCHFPKEMIGIKFIVNSLTKEQIKSIKKVNKKDLGEF